MGEIWLVRHGQASFGSSNYDRLSETGIRQCRILGGFFSKLGLEFDAIVSGRMERQIDTAKIVMSCANGGGEIEPVLMGEFNEYDHVGIIDSQIAGLLEEDPSLADDRDDFIKNREKFRRFFGAVIRRWVSGNHDAPGVETFVEYGRRIEKGISSVVESMGPDGKAVVFTSGGVISIAMRMALDLSDREALLLGWRLRNTSVSVFEHVRGRLNLASFNSTAHLELEKTPGLLTVN